MSAGRPKRWRWVAIATGAVVVGGLVFLGVRATRSTMSAMADTGPAIPTARAERGVLDIQVHMTGELRASRQQALTAPPVGGTLRILTMVENGTEVTAGDVILSFDPADQRHALEQAESELLEAEQNILKRRADIGAQEAQDQVALLTARFNVRRAELDAQVDRDLIPANEYQIRQVSLEEARKAFERTEQDILARSAVSKAGLSVLQEARMKAQIAADRARQNMEMLEIRAPIDGVVAARENLDGVTVYFAGMMVPAYRVGDMVSPGRPVVDLFDVQGMEIRATVNEQERANLAVGQTVAVTSRSAPGAALAARVQAISGLGRAVMQQGPLRRFDVTLELTTPDARLLPGTSVDLVVQGARVEDALMLPRQAVFEQDGKPIVYLKAGAGFEPSEIKILSRSESRVAIDGIDAGAEVALIKPSSVPSGAGGATSGNDGGRGAAPPAASPVVGR